MRPPAERRPAWSSRLALAASVALLVLAGWLLPGFALRPPTPEELNTLGDPTATPRGFLPREGMPAAKPGKLTPDKVKSSLHLEQGNDGRTGIKITVEELPSNK